MDGDVEDQYETLNGMPVYYGGDLCDSEDSDWDDPCALAGAACVEDYGFDVPERMDLVVHRHSRIPESSDVRQDCQMDVAPVCQTVSYATKDEYYLDSDNGSVMDLDGSRSEGAYCVVSDDGSAADLDVDMLDDSLSDIEPDVCVVPDVLPVRGETAAVEPLCFPVVVPTRSQGGCDPVLSLPRYRGGGGG